MFRPSHRYEILPPAARRIARVPRYARLLSMLNASQLKGLRTEADLFWLAFSQHSYVGNRYIGNDPKGQTGIIDDFLRTEMGNRFGWHTTGIEVDLTAATYRAWQIRLAMGMLGATAFEVMFGDSTHLPEDQIPVNLTGTSNGRASKKPLDRFLAANAYVNQRGNPLQDVTINADWETLQTMGAGGLRHFVFANAAMAGEVEEIRFNDISTQAFFAAYWACNYADVKIDYPSLWRCVPDDLNQTNLIYMEFWRFVAEMPESALRSFKDEQDKRLRWCELLAPVFDPRREHCMRDSDGNLIRSNELICRAWMSMREIRKSAPKSWERFSHIRSSEYQEMLRGEMGSERQHTARGLLHSEQEGSRFEGLCEGENENDNGVFLMGSTHPGAASDEGPVHEVHLSHYRLCRNAVTNLEYRLYGVNHKGMKRYRNRFTYSDSYTRSLISYFEIAKETIKDLDLRQLVVLELAREVHSLKETIKDLDEMQLTRLMAQKELARKRDTIRDHDPVVNVRWWDALAMALWIGDFELDGRTYEVLLPTEAQWEYACRAGSDKPFSMVDCQRQRNGWGIDLLEGNSWEWVLDWYSEGYYSSIASLDECRDPRGPISGSCRGNRGGGWGNLGLNCHTSRGMDEPSVYHDDIGFRLAAVPVEASIRTNNMKG